MTINSPRGDIPRRQCLQTLLAGAAGWPTVWPGSCRAAGDAARRGPTPIRSCILLFHYGGPSHLESFDPKPHAPADIVATVLWRFGISPELEMRDQTNRPFRLSEGQPLVELFV